MFHRMAQGRLDSAIAVPGRDEVSTLLNELQTLQYRLADNERAIHRLAYYDVLTDLPNRRLLRERIEDALQTRTAPLAHRALLLLDLWLTTATTRQHADGRERIDAEDAPADQGDHHRANADGAATDHAAASTTAATIATVFHIARFAVAFPSHCRISDLNCAHCRGCRMLRRERPTCPANSRSIKKTPISAPQLTIFCATPQ